MRGAGGTDGGLISYFLGLGMTIGGIYLLLNSIVVAPPRLGFGRALYDFGGVPITSGMIFIPFLFGVGLIFYKGQSWIGWALAGGSVLALVLGVIANTQLIFARLSAFDLIVIFVLIAGGLGLFLRSLGTHKANF
ncbi:MAG: hypothetical protein AAF826_08300 [Pseudomonadota bacterium]